MDSTRRIKRKKGMKRQWLATKLYQVISISIVFKSEI